MIALDTCILARFILRDSPEEFAIAKAFLAANRCSVGWGVLIELCWVLERSVGLSRQDVHGALSAIASLANIEFPDQSGLDWALERYSAGADFADMIHLLAVVPGSSEFVTFDRKLVRRAGKETPLKTRVLGA